MNPKTTEKVNKIKALCEELKITLSPEEVLLENNVIRKVVYFIDNETYEETKTEGENK
jgi:hypothetical protein